MPSLSHPHQNLSTASTRLTELHDRTRAAVEWCLALLIGGGVLWLVGSRNLAFAVGDGAVAAVVVGGLAVDERRRLLLGLVVQGDATSIPEVGALADRLAHDPAERRRIAVALRAAACRDRAGQMGATINHRRVAACAPRLLAVADAVADQHRVVAPSSVALCRTLLTDGAGSPLYNPNLPERELDRMLAVVEAGIAPLVVEREARPALTPGPRSGAC
jgi:hypothetical protein